MTRFLVAVEASTRAQPASAQGETQNHFQTTVCDVHAGRVEQPDDTSAAAKKSVAEVWGGVPVVVVDTASV
jgi:hypothetical protein